MIFNICKRVESFLGSFTISWEQRKLGELVQFSKGAGYSKGDLKESGTPIILYGRLYTKYETVIADVDTFADAKNGSVYSRGGEVIVPASGETAEDISIASVVEKQGILLGGDLNIITPPADLDSAFLAISISNGKPHEDMSKMAQGKSVVHLHNTDLEKIDMTYPSHEEQTQISDLFRRIDNLITLHQRESYKYSLCHHDLSDVLECLLTIYWEQRKLGEVASSFEYGLNAAAKEFDGVNKYLRITDIDDSSRVFKDDDLTSPDTDLSTAGGYQLHDGEILFARTGASVGKSFIYRESDGLVYYAGFLIRAKVKPEYDSEFIFQNTLGASYEKYIQITSQRSGQPGVNAQEYAEYTFLVPDYTEQKKIGGFLRQIDNLITLHQRKSPH